MFKNFSINATHQHYSEYVGIENIMSQMFEKQTLQETNPFFFRSTASSVRMNGQTDVSSNFQILQTTNTFDNVYTKSVTVEGELYTAEMQVAASKNNNEEIELSPNNFQITLNIPCE